MTKTGEARSGGMELTVAEGKLPNHIMTVGLCTAPNEIHYVAHRAWDSGTVSAKLLPSVSFKSHHSLPPLLTLGIRA